MGSPPPGEDPFYRYDGDTLLADLAPGTVLDTRTFHYHLFGFPTLLKATQLLYRSTGPSGAATTNVTSVIEPPRFGRSPARRVVSYQSAYDSLNVADEPSHAIAGGVRLGGVIPNVEVAVFGPFLAEGYTVVVPDIEGQHAEFAVGPVYGYNTLDSLRAAHNAGLYPDDAQIALLGYSGGALGTEWAAELAPGYAPDVNERLVGAALGGLLVDPAHNLHYVSGTPFWSGVLPLALIGISRAFDVDLAPYLSAKGSALLTKLDTASIIHVLGQYPGLGWKDLALPEYERPELIPAYVRAANRLIMGTGGTPTVPLFIGQGAGGVAELTPGDRPGIGPGDGVMIAGDVRTLVQHYCAQGVTVQYEQYDALSHIWAVPVWLLNSLHWVRDRFAGGEAPHNCARVAPGNPLDLIPMP